jgi:two-component system, LytTR family, response regulator
LNQAGFLFCRPPATNTEQLKKKAGQLAGIEGSLSEGTAVNTIISCSACNNYTEFNFSDKRKILVSRTLKEIEEMLEDYAFLRVHHSHLVNLNEITPYIKGEGGYLIMTDGSKADVSRSRKELLMHKLQLSRT